mgnify:FL=1
MCIKPGIIHTEWESLGEKMAREKRRTNIILFYFFNREKQNRSKNMGYFIIFC